MFEVTKAEDEEKTNGSPPASPSSSSTATVPAQPMPSTPKPSALRVTIPSELQGVAYIEVLCQKGIIPIYSNSIENIFYKYL